jgi:hypothetical protein
VLFDASKPYKSNAPVHVAIQLRDAQGQNISPVVITAKDLVNLATGAAGAVDNIGSLNADGNFRYVAGEYRFEVNTKGLGAGTYRLRFTAGSDPTVHSVDFSVR